MGAILSAAQVDAIDRSFTCADEQTIIVGARTPDGWLYACSDPYPYADAVHMLANMRQRVTEDLVVLMRSTKKVEEVVYFSDEVV